jgi:hypothetical protein
VNLIPEPDCLGYATLYISNSVKRNFNIEINVFNDPTREKLRKPFRLQKSLKSLSKPVALEHSNFCPKLSKTHLRASLIQKFFLGQSPRTPNYGKGRGKEYRGEGGKRWEGKGLMDAPNINFWIHLCLLCQSHPGD